MQRLINLPYAFQTIGSAMAVRAWAYAKEGGMNQRQAGEDFYFLHKFISKGTLAEINNTWVVPSSRRSSRVPFGTGKAISDAMLSRESERKSYNPESFIILQNWILHIKNASIINTAIIRCRDNALNLFLQQIQAESKLKEIEANTKGKDSFMKRFFQWFDAFLLMKYLHFMREHGYPDQPLSKCLEYLFDRLNLKINSDPLKNLTELRHIDQKLPMIETERTIFTVLSEDDVADILVMYTDKDTFKYIGPLANLTQEKYIERLQAKIKEVTDKTGYHWVCREKETKELIGVLNLNPMPGYNRLHMGYQVRQHLWGQGYGKEMSVKLVDIAFREKKLKEIYAMIESEHMVSRKILLGLGFSLFETKDEKGVTLEIYKLINPLM